LAIARDNKDVIEARVHPTLIPEAHLLSKVDGNYNAMFLSGSPIGSAMFYGQGAGMMPTSSAVVGDIIDVARNILKGVSQRVPPFSHVRESFRTLAIKDIRNVQCRYYLRFSALDRPGVLSRISGILGKNKISIHSVIQKGRKVRGGVPIFMLTHEAQEANILRALKEVDRLPTTVDKTMLIRIEDKI
jgi:homoserine dehydrogenase